MNISRRFDLVCSLFFILLLMSQCSDNPANNPESLTIDLPMNKKAVYAIAYYHKTGNSDSLGYLRISSFYFNSTDTFNDTTYLVGTYERLEPEYYDEPVSGEILISLTDDWVYFQSSEILDAGIDLMKPANGIKVDTTRLPTEKYSYFSIYPRTLIQNQTYAVYRPANAAIDWGYADVYREFKVKYPSVWEDQYGADTGFEVAVKHVLFGFTMNFDLILDRHGIVNSQNVETEYRTDENGQLIDSVLTYRINRRIVDYTEPSMVKSLSDYAAEVAAKGLKYKP